MFDRFRDWLKLMASKEGIVQRLYITVWEGIHCIWCNSIWFSAIISLVVVKDVVGWIVYTLAISTLAIMIETVINFLRSK